MSDLTKLKEILDNQSPKGIKSGNWKKLEYSQRIDVDGDLVLKIDNIEVGFCFNTKGRLVGMWNWKS